MTRSASRGDFWLLALAAVLSIQWASSAANAATTSGTAALSTCQLPGIAQPARCGTFNLPENPGLTDGRRLAIGVAVLSATSGHALPDPIVLLMGGPGEDAISAAADFAALFAPLRTDRDILLIDQRGTGRSGALHCTLYSSEDPAASLRDLFPPAAVKRCMLELAAHADLTRYLYGNFADDLEHVRIALGYGPLNLSAGSYGTRAAQVYVRAYPQSVRTVYLGSVVPIAETMPLPMAKAGQLALDNVFAACEADAKCHGAFPKLREEFREVAAQLESGTVRVAVAGHTGTLPLSRGRVAEWFRAKLYRPETAALLPWLIHRAYAGDWSAIAEGIVSDARNYDSALNFGLFFSITCSEDVAFVREQDVAAATQGTFLGDYRLRQQQAACKEWPKISLPAAYKTPVRSAVPALFISGDMDGGTPLWFTDGAAKGFDNRLEVVLGGRGHTQWSDCVGPLYERFVRAGSARGLDASSCKPVPRPPFKTQ